MVCLETVEKTRTETAPDLGARFCSPNLQIHEQTRHSVSSVPSRSLPQSIGRNTSATSAIKFSRTPCLALERSADLSSNSSRFLKVRRHILESHRAQMGQWRCRDPCDSEHQPSSDGEEAVRGLALIDGDGPRLCTRNRPAREHPWKTSNGKIPLAGYKSCPNCLASRHMNTTRARQALQSGCSSSLADTSIPNSQLNPASIVAALGATAFSLNRGSRKGASTVTRLKR